MKGAELYTHPLWAEVYVPEKNLWIKYLTDMILETVTKLEWANGASFTMQICGITGHRSCRLAEAQHLVLSSQQVPGHPCCLLSFEGWSSFLRPCLCSPLHPVVLPACCLLFNFLIGFVLKNPSFCARMHSACFVEHFSFVRLRKSLFLRLSAHVFFLCTVMFLVQSYFLPGRH